MFQQRRIDEWLNVWNVAVWGVHRRQHCYTNTFWRKVRSFDKSGKVHHPQFTVGVIRDSNRERTIHYLDRPGYPWDPLSSFGFELISIIRTSTDLLLNVTNCCRIPFPHEFSDERAQPNTLNGLFEPLQFSVQSVLSKKRSETHLVLYHTRRLFWG